MYISRLLLDYVVMCHCKRLFLKLSPMTLCILTMQYGLSAVYSYINSFF